jgi:hypothetical protein
MLTLTAAAVVGDWNAHTVRQLNGQDRVIKHPAKLQVVTSEWNHLVTEPYLVYMPEKNRLLISLVRDTIDRHGNTGVSWPREIVSMYSDDLGKSWSAPAPAPVFTGLTYFGNGKVMASAGDRWLSEDFGETWRALAPVPQLPDGKIFHRWDPMLVDTDPNTGKVVRLAEAGYCEVPLPNQELHGQGVIRFSTDEGRTWPTVIKVPQWVGATEIALARAKNGDMVAACRTDPPTGVPLSDPADYHAGLAVSVSKDNGSTWSDLHHLYQWGRHFPSMAVLPDGRLVMSYVVRMGYKNSAKGFPQFGIEAAVSHDHGKTWDLDHRYLLHTWTGKQTGRWWWWGSPICTSTVLLSDGSLLTSYCTGFRAADNEHVLPMPRDVALVKWSLGDAELNTDRQIRDAKFDSDFRNRLKPATGKHIGEH